MSRPQITVTKQTRTDSVGQEVRVGDYVAVTPCYSTRLTIGLVTRISGDLSFEVFMDSDTIKWERLKRLAFWYQVVKVSTPPDEVIQRINENIDIYQREKAAYEARLFEYRRSRR